MSNYPHSSSIATSLSTSPYAVQTNLEALIQRSRTHPHAHRHEQDEDFGPEPLIQPDSRRPSQRSHKRLFMTPAHEARNPIARRASGASGTAGGRGEIGEDIDGHSHGDNGRHPLIFGDDEDEDQARVGDRKKQSQNKDADIGHELEEEQDVDESSKLISSERIGRRMSNTRRSHGGGYGTLSAPLAQGVANRAVLEPNVRSGSSGTSRSRSKGRTPPRRVFRPLSRHKERNSGDGDSVAVEDDVDSDIDGDINFNEEGNELDDNDHRTLASVATSDNNNNNVSGIAGLGRSSIGRGRSSETRPMSRHASPVSTTSALPPNLNPIIGRRRESLTVNGGGGAVYFDESTEEDEDVARGLVATGGAGLLSAGLGIGQVMRAVASAGGGGGGGGVEVEGEFVDPCEELCADDLDIPTGDDGVELRIWHQSLRAEIPILLRSSFPIFISQLSEWSLSLASVISIGHLGTSSLAASSLANMTASVSCYSILQGLATALDTLLPAAWTSSDPSRVGLWTQRMTVVMLVSTIPMFVLWWNVEGILLGLGQEPDIAALAGLYLAWLSIGIPGYGGTVILKKYLQAQNLMHIPTYVMFVVAPTNLVLNYLLVWGPESIRLGFIGGAVATAASYNLTFVMLLIYTMSFGPREAFHPLQFKYVFTKLGTVTSLGLAGTIMLSSEWWAWEACALAASLLGPTSLAAQSVLLSTCSTLYQLPSSLGVAAAVRVGNLLGAGRGWEAKWASRASFILSVVFACGNSTICLVFKDNWGYLFNNDPQVVALVAKIMPYIALFQVADGVIATANSVLRALGLHSTGALINLTCYYIIGLPFGLWLAFARFELGLAGIWIGLSVALIYASVVEFFLVWRADWSRAVERVRERLGLPGNGHVGVDGKWHEGGEEDV